MNDKQQEEILIKMFDMVGDVYSPEKTKHPQWFLEHSWSIEQDQQFIKWLEAYLKRKRIAKGRTARKIAEMFSFQYGWKIATSDSSSIFPSTPNE